MTHSLINSPPIARLWLQLQHWRLRHPLWLLFGLALAARLLPVGVRFVIGTDEGLYLTLGQNLAQGLGYTGNGVTTQIDFPPGFPFFAALLYGLGGGLELPAKLNVLIFGSLLPLPVYWLARQLADENTGFLAGLLTAWLPALALAQGNFEAVAEPLYTLLLYTGWAVLWWGLAQRRAPEGISKPVTPPSAPSPPSLRPLCGGQGVSEAKGLDSSVATRPRSDRPDVLKRVLVFGLAGLALGAAHLVRWEGLILGLLGAGVIVLTLRRKSLLPIALFLGGLGLFAVPYGQFLYQHTGSFVSPKTTITQLHGAGLAANSSDPFALEKSYGVYEAYLAQPDVQPALPQEDRGAFLRRYLGNVLTESRLWLTSVSLMTPVWLIPAAIGAWVIERRRALFLALLLIPLAVIPASVVDARYFQPTLPAAMIFTACGWAWLGKRLGQTRAHTQVRPYQVRPRKRVGPFRLTLAPTLVAATLFVFALGDLAGPFLFPRPTEYRTAGLALRDKLPEGAHILARKRQIPFYAGATWEWLPFADLDGVMAYADSHQAEYIVIDEFTIPALRPQLAYLLDPQAAPDGLTPIYVSTDPRIVI
ncbi:MAG: ArnT family glycosyltransferase, partial [Anaerolineales bacterium]